VAKVLDVHLPNRMMEFTGTAGRDLMMESLFCKFFFPFLLDILHPFCVYVLIRIVCTRA